MNSRRALGLGAAGLIVALPLLALGPSSGASSPTAAFTGTAAADGVRVTIDIPGGPLLDKIIDIGGPTAQVSVSTLGSSTAYAALPDPGQLVNSGPGLVVGLLAQGAYGLPPLTLPNLPVTQVDPLEVNTDADGTKTGSLGAGPYAITASSAPTNGVADATGGLENLGGSAAAALNSHSTVSAAADGSVTASASATVTGLKLGPLTIGSIVSTATETLTTQGKIVGKGSTGISLLALDGVPLSLPLLDLSSSSSTGTLLKTLAPLLKPLGITVTFGGLVTSPGSVSAPTMTISMPFDTGPGGLSGTASVTVGVTTATLAGSIIDSGGPPGVGPSGSTGSVGPGAVIPPTGTVPSVVITPPSSQPSVVPVVSPTTQPQLVDRSTSLIGIFNIKALYLVLAALAVITVLLSQVIRLLGVRS